MTNIPCDVDAKPVYCSVTIDNGGRETTIEGWLSVPEFDDKSIASGQWIAIIPSVSFDPEATKLLYRIDDIVSIFPVEVPIDHVLVEMGRTVYSLGEKIGMVQPDGHYADFREVEDKELVLA